MAKPMTKTQLVSALADEMGSDKKSAGVALDAIVGIITKEVAGGGAVTLPGVGKIYCRERPARMVRNPRHWRADKQARRQGGEDDHRKGAQGQRERLSAQHTALIGAVLRAALCSLGPVTCWSYSALRVPVGMRTG